MSWFSVDVTKCSNKSNLKESDFNLCHSLMLQSVIVCSRKGKDNSHQKLHIDTEASVMDIE